MLRPDIYVKSVLQIDFALIKKLGVVAIILDVDNTIRRYKDIQLLDGVLKWVETMKSYGFKVVIVSNNFKRRVEPVASMLGVQYVSLGFKPLPFGLNKAFKKVGVEKDRIVVVGDQFFTDVIGAKIKGFKTILVKPIEQESGLLWKLRRNIEKKILKKFLK